MENISVAKGWIWLGHTQHLNASSPPVLDVRRSPPRRSDHFSRTLPPPDPLLPRLPCCHSNFLPDRHHPPHLGPSILRPPRFTLIHYAIDTLQVRDGRDKDWVDQVHRRSSRVDSLTSDAVGGDKVDIPVECVGCAHQRSFDVNYRERAWASCSRGEMDSQDFCFIREWSRERNR